jgi:hypothetical protein
MEVVASFKKTKKGVYQGELEIKNTTENDITSWYLTCTINNTVFVKQNGTPLFYLYYQFKILFNFYNLKIKYKIILYFHIICILLKLEK